MKEKRFSKIYIEITNICNLNCAFCPDTRREKMFISVEDFEQIIIKIKPYTNLIHLHVKGEPLMHPQLEEILDICQRYEISVNITTNATLLLKQIEALKQSKAIRQINLSVHSVNQNKNSDAKTYLDDVIKAVRILHDTTDILISFRLWNFNNENATIENKAVIEALEAEYNIEGLAERASQNKAVKLKARTYLNQDVQFTWPDLKAEVISEKGKCFGLRNQIAILVNGDIVPCCLDQEGDIKLGNIYADSLKDVIDSKQSKSIIYGFEKHEVVEELCKRCGFRTRFGNK